MIFDDEELVEATRGLKWRRMVAAIPFTLLMLILMAVAWLVLMATYFVCLTSVQIQGSSGPENKSFHRFRLWLQGRCYDCYMEQKDLEDEERGQ